MASLTQCLPVIGVPHQLRISVMRLDVVDFSGWLNIARTIADDTESMIDEVSSASGTPGSVIATLGSRSSTLIDLALLLAFVFLTSAAIFDQLLASWPCAWMLWRPWHIKRASSEGETRGPGAAGKQKLRLDCAYSMPFPQSGHCLLCA